MIRLKKVTDIMRKTEKIRRRAERALIRLLSGVAIITLMTVLPGAAAYVYAGNADKNILLGAASLKPVMSSVKEEINGAANTKERVTTAQTVYYGHDKDDPDTAKKWLAIGYDGYGAVKESGKLTLFSTKDIELVQFRKSTGVADEKICYYDLSLVKPKVDSYYDSLFSDDEQSPIALRTLSHGAYNADPDNLCDGVLDQNGTSAYLWPLSTKEADLIQNKYFSDFSGWGFWLRSPGSSNNRAAIVQKDDPKVSIVGTSTISNVMFTRPAFNLKLSSVLMTSSAEGGKVSGEAGEDALRRVDYNTTGEWKLTLLDPGRNGFSIGEVDAGFLSPGSKVSFDFSGAEKGENEYVSAVITDPDGSVLYYGHIAECSVSKGEAAVNIPDDSSITGDCKLYVFQEKCNSDKKTDLSSPMIEIAFSSAAEPVPDPAAWDLLSYSGKQSSFFKGTDGKYYAVKGTKIQADKGASSSDKKVLNVDKKGVIKVGKSGSAALSSERYGNIEVNVINPKLSSKKAETEVGGIAELSLTGVPEGVPVAWQSSDQDVVQVLSGKCYGVGIGKAKVEACVGGRIFKAKVTVKDKPGTTLIVNVDTSKPKKIKGLKNAGKLTYTVMSDAVTIEKGKITAAKASKTPVSANVSDGHKLLIYVNDTALTRQDITLKTGEKALILNDNMHEFPEFKSKDNRTASVSEYGVVVGQAAGKTVITAKTGGKKVKVNVTVTEDVYEGSTAPGEIRDLRVVDDINGNPGSEILIEDNGNADIVIKEGKHYTVHFDANGGTGKMSDLSMVHGASKALPANSFVKQDYVFTGWALSPDGPVVYKDTENVSNLTDIENGTVTLYACWSAALKFSSDGPFTLGVENRNWDGSIEYSYDAEKWTEWDGSTLNGSPSAPVYLRGTGNTVITGGRSNSRKWTFSGKYCSGNVENLLDYQAVIAGNHPIMNEMCFSYMFYGCTTLADPPELSAENLSDNCYDSMFNGCTLLRTAPSLPSRSLAAGCYFEMFKGCTGLRKAPALSAKTLSQNCYGFMFRDCSALESAPVLPAKALADICYFGMFQGCAKLKAAPSLPAITLAKGCYEDMFYGCTALTGIPELPASAMVESCYNNMFNKCKSIKISNFKDAEYTIPYRVPAAGQGTEAIHPETGYNTNSRSGMFTDTGGGAFSYTSGAPELGKTYYLHSTNYIVD